MRKLGFILVLAIIISSGFCFNIQITPVDSSVQPGETILYDINLINDAGTSKTVVMYMISEKLNPAFSPAYQVVVPASSTEVVRLSAAVSESAVEGRYYDSVYFEIDDIIQTSQTISYTVEGPEQYFTFNNIEVPSQVDPRDEFNLTVNFENLYNRRIERVYATIEVYEEDGTSLYYSLEVMETPLGNNSVVFPINLDDNLTPRIANARVSIEWYDMSFGSKIEQFSIIGYAENNTEMVSSTNIVTSTSGIIIENNGTLVIQSFDYEIPVNNFDIYFISGASVDYTLTSNSVIFHVPELYPGDSLVLFYETNYGTLYLLPFVVISLIYLFYYFTRKVSVKREIFEFKSSHNTISFKVVLNITNVSNKLVSRVRVREFLPLIISEVFDYGTLKGEIKTVKGLKFIEWNLGKMKPGENIILSYKMRSKVGFFGELKLDKTTVEVLNSDGSVQSTVHTNTIMVDINPASKKMKKE